jgi:hypothetical protein
MAQYTTDRVFELIGVEDRLREALPPRAAFAAGPIAGQLQGYVRQTVQRVLGSDRFQPIWVELNRRAHTQAVAILKGESTVVVSGRQQVDIDLLPLINQVLRDLEDQLPTLFGHRLGLPDLGSGAIPPNLRATVESAVGVTLPANFAQFTVYDAGRLHAMQLAVLRLRRWSPSRSCCSARRCGYRRTGAARRCSSGSGWWWRPSR